MKICNNLNNFEALSQTSNLRNKKKQQAIF